MFCRYCGCEYQDDAIFCLNCGKKIEEESIEIVNSNIQFIEPENRHYDLGSVCMQYRFTSKHVTFGDPIDNKNCSFFDNLVKKFEISRNEKVYFAYHLITNLKTEEITVITEGFAICSSGIYGKDTNGINFYICWDQFKYLRCSKNMIGDLVIDDHEIVVGFGYGNDAKTILRMFDAIKASI